MTANKPRPNGFTLIELIGVMSIIAILASVITPNVLDDVIRARQQQETQNLKALSDSLQNYVLSLKRIPGSSGNDWALAIAQYSKLPNEGVSKNARGFRRGYYVDPAFLAGPDRRFEGYAQADGLTSAPRSPRIMLISMLSADAPEAPVTADGFEAIWQQSASATLQEGPNVLIERINLRPMFHRLILINEHPQTAVYQLEKSDFFQVPAARVEGYGETTRYVIANTRLNLFAAPFSAQSASLGAVLVDHGLSLVYQRDGERWRWQQP